MNPPSFILIPYQLLADETINPIEEKLYGFVYWFTKLRNERCTAGNDALAALAKTTPGVVQNSLRKLEQRGYIRRTYKDRNNRVRDEIIPLIDFANVENQAPVVARPRKPRVKKEEPKKELQEATDQNGAVINGLIELFEPVNPSYERLFAIKPQRQALERLVRKLGVEKVMHSIKYAVEVQDKPYAPSITTPLQLEGKLGQLIGHYKKENGKGPKLVEI